MVTRDPYFRVRAEVRAPDGNSMVLEFSMSSSDLGEPDSDEEEEAIEEWIEEYGFELEEILSIEH